MKSFLILAPLVLTATIPTACTVSIIQTDTHGTAEDVVDDTTRTDSKVDADLTIPIKPI